MTSSDYIQSLRVTEKDNFPDIGYYNMKKAAMVLRALLSLTPSSPSVL